MRVSQNFAWSTIWERMVMLTSLSVEAWVGDSDLADDMLADLNSFCEIKKQRSFYQ